MATMPRAGQEGRWRRTEPSGFGHRRRRRLGVRGLASGLAVVVLAALTGCAVSTGQPDQVDKDRLPVAVDGLAGCANLDGRPGSASSDGLPRATLPCLNDVSKVDIAALRGPTIVNLWASWCSPCRKELPRLADAARRSDRVGFLGVDTRDDAELAGALLEELGVTYPQVVDAKGTVLDATRVPGLPVTLAVDAEGRIVDRVIGEVSDNELARLLSTLTTAG